MVGIFIDHPSYSDDLLQERDCTLPREHVFLDRKNDTIDREVEENQYNWYLNYVLVRSEN